MLMDCTVDVAGNRFNDGTGRPPGDPDAVVLSGLSVIWGRNTTVDQPQPATCTFTVEDWTGGNAWLAGLQVGQSVDVDAAGIDSQTPTLGTFDDPTLTRLAPVSTNVPGLKPKLLPGGAGVTVDATNLPPRSSVYTYLRPDDPSPVGSAWIEIPRLGAGQVWQVRVTGSTPYGAAVNFLAFGLPAPDSGVTSDRIVGLPGGQVRGAFDVTLSLAVPAALDGQWCGVSALTTGYLTWATTTGTWSAQPQTWADMARTTITYVDALAPTDARRLAVRVFSGRITDLETAYDPDGGGVTATVTAADLIADLANRRVEAQPWPTEAAATRIDRILTAAGNPVQARLDDGIGAYLIGAQDVDAQSPVALLDNVASSVDAVRWPATSELDGPYLWFENPGARTAGRTLRKVGGIIVVLVDTAGQDALVIDACAALRDTVTWRQDTSDVLTRVGVKWAQLGVDIDGKPTSTEHTEWLRNTAAEAAFGVLSMTVDTQLTTQTDALTIAAEVAGRVWGTGWRIDGLTVHDAALADAGVSGGLSPTVILAQLLDGTRRIGRMTELDGMPAWAPNVTGPDQNPVVYLEGGRYTYAGGDWTLALVTSDPRGQGTGATWAELPLDWLWNQFHPDLTWAGIRGAVVGEAVTTTPAWPGIAFPGVTFPGVGVWRTREDQP